MMGLISWGRCNKKVCVGMTGVSMRAVEVVKEDWRW